MRRSQRGYVLLTVVVTLFLLGAIVSLLVYDSANNSHAANSELAAARAEYVARAGMQNALWRAQNNACLGDVTIDPTALGNDEYAAQISGASAGSLVVLDADKDAWIRSDDVDRNNGTGGTNHVRSEAGKIEQILTRFDVSSIAANSQILSATAWFFLPNSKDHPEGAISAYEITADWDENSVTWGSFNGKYRAGAVAVIPAQVSGGTWVRINVTGLVQSWVNGQPNNGILLGSSAEGLHTEYQAREDGANPPRLEVVVGTGPASPIMIASTGTLADGVSRSITKSPETAYQPPTGFEVTSGDGISKDTMMKQDAQSNNLGANDNLWVQDTSGGNGDQALLQFDLSGIPSSARVTGATLSLHQHYSGTPGGTVEVRRLMKDWDEGSMDNGPGDGVTWLTYDWSDFWASPGGDYGSQAWASTTIPSGGVGRHEWDITSLVDGWLSGEIPNQGLILLPAAPGTDVGFYSSDFADASLHPRLTVTFACECGTPCMAAGGSGRIALIGDDWTPDPDDQFKIQLLESWGYDVDFYQDRDSGWINWSNYDLAYVSETAIANDVNANLEDLSIGVVNEEPKLYDNLRMASGDTEYVGSAIDIIENGHFITSVFPVGPLSIYTGGMEILTADAPLAGGLQTLGEFGGRPTLAILEQGAEATSGTASGRRVILPLGQHFAAGFDWKNLNHNAHLLVQRSIDWAMGADANFNGLTVMFVVVNPNSLTNQESLKKAMIESWGYEVSLIDESDPAEEFETSALNADVVFVSEDVTASTVGNKLNSVATGVVVEEANLVDELGFASSIGWDLGNKLTIDNGFYITQPFAAGSLSLLTTSESLAYLSGSISPDAKRLGNSDNGPALVALAAGAQLVGGGVSAGRRVLLPWGGNNMDFEHLNDNGLAVFQRALQWAASAEPGFVAHWKLDDASGLVAIDSVGGHDGTLLNGPTWANGAIDGGVQFSGSTQAISVANADSLTILDDFTLAGWFYLDEMNPNRPIVMKGTSNIDLNYYLGISQDQIQFAMSPSGGGWYSLIIGALPITTGAWYHAAVSFDNDSKLVRFYLDGVAVGKKTSTHGPSEFAGPVRIGRNDTGYGFGGRLDDVRIYRRTLAADEIAEIFDASKAVPEAHWKLDETSGAIAIDSIGNHDGTLTNGPIWASGREDGGLDFDGVDDYVDLTSDLGLTNIFDGGATVTAWIYPRGWGESDNGRILDKASAVSGDRDGWMIGLRGETPALQFAQGFTGTRGFWRSEAGTVALNEWVHIAVVYDASSVANDAEIYLDGVRQTPLVEITPSGTVASDEGIRLRMGNYAQDTSRTFDGIIDDVRIFDRMLSASEIADLVGTGGSPPIAHWMLDETSGTTAEDSAGGHDGSLANGPTWVSGRVDGALRFDGSNDRVNVPHDNGLSLVSRISLSAWVYADAFGPLQMVLTKGDNGVNENYWLATEGNKVNFGFVDGGVYAQHTTSGLSLQTGRWHHIAATFDDATNEVRIYLDGVAETFTNTNTPDTNSERLIIGNSYYGEAFDGRIDDVQIHNRVLGADDIVALASGGGGGGPGGGCDATFIDRFNVAESYNGSDGTGSWTTPWLEINESDGPGSGDERVVNQDSSYHLQVRDNDGGGEGVQREADLSAHTSAILSLEYRRDGFDNNRDWVRIDVSDNGGATWNEVRRILGPGTDSSYVSWSRDISSYISSNTRIRFLTSSRLGSGDELYVDNVTITASGCAN